MGNERQDHWDAVYTSKTEQELSWHESSPTASYRIIREIVRTYGSVIDIGGGTSPLAEELVLAGFMPVTVVDISSAAVDRAKKRLAPSICAQIDWRVKDILASPDLPSYDLWHDRAVFHFFTESRDRDSYVELVERTVLKDGLLVIGAFASDGPQQCSCLPVQRYDAKALARVFQSQFRLLKASHELHRTPWDVNQSFVYVVMQRR